MTEAKRNWLRLNRPHLWRYRARGGKHKLTRSGYDLRPWNRGYAWETAETAVCNLNWQDEDSQGTYTRRDNAARIYDSVCYRDAVENITSRLYF